MISRFGGIIETFQKTFVGFFFFFSSSCRKKQRTRGKERRRGKKKGMDEKGNQEKGGESNNPLSAFSENLTEGLQKANPVPFLRRQSQKFPSFVSYFFFFIFFFFSFFLSLSLSLSLSLVLNIFSPFFILSFLSQGDLGKAGCGSGDGILRRGLSQDVS